MKIKHFFLMISALCVFITVSFSPAMAGKKEIQWQPYETGMKMIKDQNKKGFLHFIRIGAHTAK